MMDHIERPISRVTLGASKKNAQLALIGTIISLKRSLTPSAIAWRLPQKPVTFGPFLL